MRVNILGDTDTPAYCACRDLLEERGHRVTSEDPVVAIAPLLTRILSVEEIREPDLGTLIFHPSPLPYGRGASAIRYAYMRKEPITAATWFWADPGIDSGDICEQEILRIDYERRPREFYEKHVIPAMVRTLARALESIERGYVRRVPQRHEYASYDKRL
jgi:methionyl-tRNA formyltransferase